jgi:hypothetical protein
MTYFLVTTKGGFPTWALDVADDASGWVIDELDADLGDTASGAWKEQTDMLDQRLLCLVITNAGLSLGSEMRVSNPSSQPVPASPINSKPFFLSRHAHLLRISTQRQPSNLKTTESLLHVPVRPRTLVTLAYLTGTLLEASMVARYGRWIGRERVSRTGAMEFGRLELVKSIVGDLED